MSNGLCECGCGQPTKIAPRTHNNKGIAKGQPQRFIAGHGARKPRAQPPVYPDDTARYIPLTRGKFVLVDAADYEWLNRHVWLFTQGYAARNDGHRTVFMHNVLMKPPAGFGVDHRNLNKLDNRRDNFRFCTVSQNNANGPSKGGTSLYKGVSWCKRDSQWLAQIQAKNKTYRLGQFNDEVEAAKIYDAAARKHFGEFARCNFPLEGFQS